MSEEERCLKRSDTRRKEQCQKIGAMCEDAWREQRCLDRRAMPRERSPTLMHG